SLQAPFLERPLAFAQRYGIEVSRGEGQRSFQKWRLQAGILCAGTEADRVRVWLAFLDRMHELIAADPIVESAGSASNYNVLARLPGKPEAWRECRERYSILAREIPVEYANAIRWRRIVVGEVLWHDI